MKPVTLLYMIFGSIALASNRVIFERQSCGSGYEICAPPGADSQSLPEAGPLLKNLYTDLIQTIDASGASSVINAGPAKRQDMSVSFCCVQGSDCLLLSSYGAPFCWDRFTTDFIFPDGSYGSVVAGNYSSASGTMLDLVYGSYKTKDGQTGNIYDGTPSDRPNTATMTMPTPFTSSGVGSAIPASELGTMSVLSSPAGGIGGTLTAITLPSLTISVGPTACSRCLSHTPGPTATESKVTSSARPSIFIPPFNSGRRAESFSCAAFHLLIMLVAVTIFHAM